MLSTVRQVSCVCFQVFSGRARRAVAFHRIRTTQQCSHQFSVVSSVHSASKPHQRFLLQTFYLRLLDRTATTTPSFFVRHAAACWFGARPSSRFRCSRESLFLRCVCSTRAYYIERHCFWHVMLLRGLRYGGRDLYPT